MHLFADNGIAVVLFLAERVDNRISQNQEPQSQGSFTIYVGSALTTSPQELFFELQY